MKKTNLKKFINKLELATKDDLYELQLLSANAKTKELYIFEKWNLNDIIWEKKAEELRKIFLKNNIKTKQITNSNKLPKFSKNDTFINKLMQFRYVPKDVFETKYEILIFDDIVAIYDSKKLLIIEDAKNAYMQKQLFENVWEQWQLANLDFEYKPSHSYYNSIDLFVNNIQIILWPDVDAILPYKGYTKKDLEEHFAKIINSDPATYKNVDYIISFIWDYNWNKMTDIWRFNSNNVDDRSGPLSQAIVYKNWKKCDNLWLASWSTLLALWYEEKLRRQSKSTKEYLNSKQQPKLPLEIMNWKDFLGIK